MGRGGAVRRRKSASEAPQPAEKRASPSELPSSDTDDSKTAAAAGDLLQLAAAASGITSFNSTRARAGQSGMRSRDAKPYQRRPSGRGGRGGSSGSDDCWLPGGFWWQNGNTPMPSGRQPGELAGWTPLAGERTQQRLQEHRQALSHKEQIVQGLGSRDDAAAYLQQLRRTSASQPFGSAVDEVKPITRSVDDSAIAHSSTFKQLASWGGFRRHFKEEEVVKDEDEHTSAQSSSGMHVGGAHDDIAQGDSSLTRKQLLAEQLLAKRAEVLATQKRLESLSLEQKQLEMLYTSASS